MALHVEMEDCSKIPKTRAQSKPNTTLENAQKWCSLASVCIEGKTRKQKQKQPNEKKNR